MLLFCPGLCVITVIMVGDDVGIVTDRGIEIAG